MHYAAGGLAADPESHVVAMKLGLLVALVGQASRGTGGDKSIPP